MRFIFPIILILGGCVAFCSAWQLDNAVPACGRFEERGDISSRRNLHGASTKIYSVTAYCTCSRCCGKADGVTASGVRMARGATTWRGMRVVAAPRSIPFYTVLEVQGIGKCVVLDRGGAITAGHLDLLCASHAEAVKFGRQMREAM